MSTNNPRGPANGSIRENRGGSRFYYNGLCQITSRDGYHPYDISNPNAPCNSIGFQLCRTAP
ncbi:MAG: hypothetical protein M0R50_03815 [Candidatus Cloacimonetes bacterium]|nr:hypothetical protein [Candidatus Cloacimonadota bacterium]